MGQKLELLVESGRREVLVKYWLRETREARDLALLLPKLQQAPPQAEPFEPLDGKGVPSRRIPGRAGR